MSPLANNAALLFTVALLMVTAYFFLGSVPLLTLKHDNPEDARFIRSFYNTYYRIAFFVALATTAAHALAQRPGFAMGAATIAMLAWMQRGRFIPQMEMLGARIQDDGTTAIALFRKIHKTALGINLGQLVAIVLSLGAY